MNLRSAISKVNAKGMLLVFPLDNRKEPPSLWSEFYPRSKMRWEWDVGGDTRVSDLWNLREKLSRSGQVVYSKWYRGRATLFSFELFTAVLRLLNPNFPDLQGLSLNAREVLDLLREDSPLATKQLKRMVDLQGRENESIYQRTLKELWERGLIVVYGEVDEGAFPSIAIGATEVLFEDLWSEATGLTEEKANEIIEEQRDSAPAFYKFFNSVRKKLAKERALASELAF